MDVLTAAWVGAGSPTPYATSLTGDCSHCGSRDQLVAVRAGANPSGRGVCPGCAWGYATAELRAGAHLVTRDPASLAPLDRAGVAALLRSGPLGADSALVVPLRPGRKHLLPMATWGRVAVEDVGLGWNHQEVARHRAVVSGYDLPAVVPPGLDPDAIVDLFARDKKAVDGVTFVLDGPRGVEPVRVDDRALLLAALDAVRDQ